MGRWRLLAAVAAALSMGGCATVTRGLDSQVQVNSDPPGATVQTSLSQQCVTPCTLKVARKDEFTVTISKPGYEPQSIFVTTKLAEAGAAGFAGNVLVGGIVGMGVDAATGATLEHYPNPVTAALVPLRPGAPQRGRGKPPPVAVRPAGPPEQAPVAMPAADAGVRVVPPISERDQAAFSRN
jgi:hypothetical protein